MAWSKPRFSRGEVDKAGIALVEGPRKPESWDLWEDTHDAYDWALMTMENWRVSHSYPLQVLKMTLRTRAKKIAASAITAQRLKRLKSVVAKLAAERNAHMKLSQMQDIGGCRAIMPTVLDVERLVKRYELSNAKNPAGRPEFVKKYDYIGEPKNDGYRSIHLVYKYRTTAKHLVAFNGLRIEIQLRSQLQHAWATAVETVSTFTGQALKSNIGSDDWKRFFVLMGSAIARRERRPLVPGTPTDEETLIKELRELSNRLRVQETLQGWSYALDETKVREYGVRGKAKAYLLVLNPTAYTLDVTGFNDLAKASEEYTKVEKELSTDISGTQAVLVSVDKLSELRTAYPNYRLDTTAFVMAVKRATMLPRRKKSK
jgi:ppGpp synthetase/RelA/SpoT-type nucleotidyltranferase